MNRQMWEQAIGQRVRISAAGIHVGILQKSGTLHSIDSLGYPFVIWDGRKTPTSYHADFIELEQK